MNVLLLSDFSPIAINATHYAMDLLQDQEVDFHLLNIYNPDPECIEDCASNRKAATVATLAARVEKLQKRSKNGKHKITAHYSEDKLVNAARDYLTRHRINLIVMGAVGENLRHLTILGNHTFEIITKVKCNLLAVPEGAQFSSLDKLLMPFDIPTSIRSSNLRFLRDHDIFKKKELNVWKLLGQEGAKQENDPLLKEVFASLEEMRVRFSSLKDEKIQDKKMWEEVQANFDLVVLLGKNIRICDRLLNNRHGPDSRMPNRLPILILHD